MFQLRTGLVSTIFDVKFWKVAKVVRGVWGVESGALEFEILKRAIRAPFWSQVGSCEEGARHGSQRRPQDRFVHRCYGETFTEYDVCTVSCKKYHGIN